MSNHSATTIRGRDMALPPAAPGPAGQPAAAAMPGWHIYADLTPPEFAAERRLRRVRFGVVIAVILVAAGAVAGYQLAHAEARDAADLVAAEEAVGQSLRSQQQQFANVTQLRGTIDRAREQLAMLMSADVDIDALVSNIWAALPEGMTINQFAVTIQAPIGGQTRASAAGAAALDTSASEHIGTVTLSGTGTDIDDVPTFIDNLSDIAGIFSPFPTSNQATGPGATAYSLQFSMTDTLLTGRYALEGEN